MAQKRWKLAVTEVGASNVLAESVVEAGDWMTALTRARAALGEKGGVPPGASCQVAADGRVTILDGVARRKYSLAPTEEPAAAAAAAAEPVAAAPAQKKADLKRTMAYMPGAGALGLAVPGSPAPGAAPVGGAASAVPSQAASAAAGPGVAPASVAPPKAASVPPPAPGSVPPRAASVPAPRPASVPAPRPASVPPPSSARPPSAAPAAAAPVSAPDVASQRKKVAKQTMAYMPAEVTAALAAGVVPGGAGAPAVPPSPAPPAAMASEPAAMAPEPVVAAAASLSTAASAPEAAAGPAAVARKKVAKQTMAYMPAEVAAALAGGGPAAAPAASAAGTPDAPGVPMPGAAAGSGSSRPPAAEPAAAALPAMPPEAPTKPPSQPLATAGDVGLEVLSSRDAEPSKESPLTYRERNWLVPAEIAPEDAEHILRVRFTAIREELAPRPKGKLVKLALFDHRWVGQPQRPPVLALQWKDWRGEPEIVAPARASAPGAPATAAPAAQAPAAVVAAPAVSASVPPAAAEPVLPASQASASRSGPAPTASRPPPAPEASVMVDPSLYAPPAPSRPPPAAAAPAPAPAGALHPRQDRLAEAFEALQDLFFLPTPFEGVEFVLRLLSELVPSEASAIVLYDINTHELRFAGAVGAGAEERKGDAVPGDAGLFGAALHHPERCLIVPDVAHEARFDPGVDGRVGLEATNVAVMPVGAHGRLLGAIQLVNRIGELEFSASDANLLVYVGQRLGEFLHQHKTSEQKKPAPGAQTSAARRRP